MYLKRWKTVVLLVNILLLFLVTPNSFASNYNRTFNAQVKFGLANYELYVSIPSSLYDYYHGISPEHAVKEYPKMITPDAVKPIAESLRNITGDSPRSDEDFANAVLMVVHQIPYIIDDVKYPIETIVENSGKCDTLSLLAASIMKAGGLDVVLLYFKQVNHINVGVYLPYEPRATWWWLSPTGYEVDGRKYWIAECTPAMEWKVGDLPPLLTDATPSITFLENTEKSSPASLSSKLGSPLNSSSISINLSSNLTDVSASERTLTISGSILPAYQNETVAVYFSQNGISYSAFKTETDSWGNYSYSWSLTSTGTYYVRTSWAGNSDCAGADSEILTVFLGFPQSLIQFKGPDYYYTYGRPYISSHELRVRQGVEEFLDMKLSGAGVSLTGEFIVIKSGQIITIPITEETNDSMEEITIPKGFELMRLPDDIEYTTNNQFGFVLRNSGADNYTLNVRALNNYEMTKIEQFDGNSTAFMNTSAQIRENTWYRVVAALSDSEIMAQVHDGNGTLLESVTIKQNATKVNELVIVMANNTDRAVVFKNLNVKTLNQPTQMLEGNEKAVISNESLAPSVTFMMALTLFFAIVYVRKRKKRAFTNEPSKLL